MNIVLVILVGGGVLGWACFGWLGEGVGGMVMGKFVMEG